jgi:hypothetical protein
VQALNHVQERIQTGDVSGALGAADALLRSNDLAAAAGAYWMIGEANPTACGRYFGIAADLFADVGNYEAAASGYHAAVRFGADPGWLTERLGRLHMLAYDAFISPGGKAATIGSSQNGIVVVRPRFVAFIPREQATTLGEIGARLAVRLGGVQFIELAASMTPRTFADELRALPSWRLDVVAPELAARSGGLVWKPVQASLCEDMGLVRRRLYFAMESQRVHIGFAKNALADPVLLRLRRHFWSGGPVG